MKLGPAARALVASALCLAVLAFVMSVRAALEARAELANAERALAADDLDAAIAALRRSARWHGPGNPYSAQAWDALERLATTTEARGDTAHALAAYRAIHASIHASAGFHTPRPDLLARTDERIARLMAAAPPAEIDAALSPAQQRALYLALLQGREARSGWVLLAGLGFLTWVVATSVFLLRGVDERGRVVRQVARRSGFVLLLGWIVFALGLRMA